MKVTFSTVRNYGTNNVSAATKTVAASNSIKSNYQPYGVISFGGKDPNQIAVVAAEAPQYAKAGGVATVVEDYIGGKVFPEGSKVSLHLPYYNGMRYYNEDGELLKDVFPYKGPDGKLYFVAGDRTGLNLSDSKVWEKLKKWELTEVAKGEMDFAGKTEQISAYMVNRADERKDILYFSDDVARMKVPYQNGTYSSKQMAASMSDGADAYAKSMKSMVKLMPKLEGKGINPQYIVLNDSQTAWFPEFMAREVTKGENHFFDDVKAFYVQHNLGDGTYQGPTSYKTMFMNFAEKAQVEAVWNDPAYHIAIRDGKTEEYFAKFFNDIDGKQIKGLPRKVVQRADGVVTASQIPIAYAKSNNLTGIATVSEEYAKSALDNPLVTKGMNEDLLELQKIGKFRGILNGLDNAAINPTKVSSLDYYKETVTDNLGHEHKPFETYDPKLFEGAKSDVEVAEEIVKIKQRNMLNLFERLQPNVEAKYAIGREKPTDAIIGSIDTKWIDKLKRGEKVDLFVAWGRADEQKGLDIVLNAFENFVQNNSKEADNAVLVLGGELKGAASEKVIRAKLAQLLADSKFKGRIVYMDGFAPNTILAGAADAAIFPSRFAPCELTDLEAMKFGTTPIVTNLQGLLQKNFDPRIAAESERATSFKTSANSKMPINDVLERDSIFKAFYDKLKKQFTDEYTYASIKKESGEISSFTPESIAKIVEKKLADSQELKTAYKEATDRLIIADVETAMLAKVKQTPELKAKMMKNGMFAQVGWRNNHLLHPEELLAGETRRFSSAEIYDRFFLKGLWEKFKRTLFKYDLMPAPAANTPATSISDATRSGTSDLIEVAGNSRGYGRIIGTVAGVLAILGLGYYMFKGDNKTNKHPSSYIA